jgi:hypothetical protein
MNKNSKGILVVGVFLALGGVYYYFTMTKIAYAKTIAKASGVDFRKYLSMDKGFLKARAKAIKGGEGEFVYNGKSYSTKSGMATQS